MAVYQCLHTLLGLKGELTGLPFEHYRAQLSRGIFEREIAVAGSMVGVLRDFAFYPTGGQGFLEQAFDLCGNFTDRVGPIGCFFRVGPKKQVF